MTEQMAKTRVDPVITEIVRNGVIAVTEEMKTNLTRTAYNPIIYEALDFTVGLYTADGRTVSIGLGLPMFIRGMAETVKACTTHFGLDDLKPGDVLITNDAYVTGSHLNHITLTQPIFHESKLAGFACCMAHWTDIGGVLGAMTTDIYAEGLQIPFLKLYREGKVNQDLIDIIRMNVRLPERAVGDLRAQLTAVRTGDKRFSELLERYGQDNVLAAIEDIMDHSEVAARARARSIPDGVYEAESYMDDDGIEVGKRIPIKVKVTVEGESVTIDLSEVSQQVRGFYNSGATTGFGCCQVAYKCLTSPTDYPINEGSFRALKTVIPDGRVISATRPAPMRWWMTFPMTVIDTVFKALAPAIPDRVIAGHHADLMMCVMHGIDPRTGRFYIGAMGPCGGGWGAKRDEDGVSATICMNDGDTHNTPVEMMESRFPIYVERHALVPDSGGPGERRGGLGLEYVVRSQGEMSISTQVERVHCAPWGLEDGMPGNGNRVELIRDGGRVTDLPNAKVLLTKLKKDDGYVLRSGGGGGFGAAWRRDTAAVLHDVRQGYISRDAAATHYGVVLTRDGSAVDETETGRRRAVLAQHS
jgi:N-methylhydantoinase B